MKVFLSWSGVLSKKVAEALNEWFPQVIQSVEPFFSPDIQKGKIWQEKISSELEKCNFSIVCLTPKNLHADWILFETGAISKIVSESNVATFLINLNPSDVQEPLSMYQATKFEKDDVFKLLKSINNNMKESGLKPEILKNVFDKWWPDLEDRITEALASKDIEKIEQPTRKDSELLAEILQIVRGIQSDFSKSKSVRLSDLIRKLPDEETRFPDGFKVSDKESFLNILTEIQKKQQMSKVIEDLLDLKQDKPEGSKNIINKDADKDSSKNITNK